MSDHGHLRVCIEDSSNFYLFEGDNEVVIRQMNSKKYFSEAFENEEQHGQALANAVRWMLDQQYGKSLDR